MTAGMLTLTLRKDEAELVMYALRFRHAYLEANGRSLKLIREVETKVEAVLAREHAEGAGQAALTAGARP